MKLNELLLEDTPFAYARAMNAKFKQYASEAGYVWVHGMGWPQVMKDGFWFGGGLKPSGRKGGDDSIIRPGDLSFEAVKKFILKSVAADLETAMKAGQTVKVANADRKASTIDVKPGEAYDALVKTIKVMMPPGGRRGDPNLPTVAWYISKPLELAGIETVRLDVSLHVPYVDTRGMSIEDAAKVEKNTHASFITGLPIETAKKLILWFHGRHVFKGGQKITKHPSWKDDNSEHSEYDYSEYDYSEVDASNRRPKLKSHKPASKEYVEYEKRVVALCAKHGIKVPKNLDGVWTALSPKTGVKGAITIPSEEFLALFKEFPGA